MNENDIKYLIMNTEGSPATVQCQVLKKLETFKRAQSNPLMNENGLYDLDKVGKMEVYECPSFKEAMGVNVNGKN